MPEGYICEYQYSRKDGTVGLGGCCNLLEGIVNCPYSIENIIHEEREFKIKECGGFKISLSAKNRLESISKHL